MNTFLKKYADEFLILILSSILFIPFLGKTHLFDWDEINFAEAAREMIVTGNYFQVQIDFKQFWEKPPLFIWMQVLSMKMFGVNEFAARFPNAVAGFITFLSFLRIGKKHFNREFAWFWVMCYAGTILSFLYFKSGIIDPWFNLFIFLAIYQFSFLVDTNQSKKDWRAILAGVFLGLAVLTKGPVAILIALLCLVVYVVVNKFDVQLKWMHLFLTILFTSLVSLLWFGVEMQGNGFWFIKEFIIYQIRLFSTRDAGHGGPFFYHWIVLLIGCFPASILLLKTFITKSNAEDYKKVFLIWMKILFWVVLILFSIVKTKIVHYSSLCYFPLSFLAAYAIYQMVHGRTRWNKWIHYFVYIIGSLVVITLIGFPYLMINKHLWIDSVKDVFAVGNLQAVIDWSYTDTLGGLVLIIGLIIYAILNSRHHYRKALVSLFISMTIMIFCTSVLIVPKIELFSQAAVIRFYESKQHEDAYIQPMYFKSYAHLFYTKKKPVTNVSAYDHEWLKAGEIDKPVYIVVKNTKKHEMEKYPDIKLLYEENGFVFFLRSPQQ